MQRRLVTASLLGWTVMLAAACSSAGPTADPESKRRSIDAGVDNATAQLYAQVKGSRELIAKSRGVLVFPKVVSAGLVLAGSYGEGSLQASGTRTYYSTGSASVGLTVGADSKAVFVLFLTDEALKKFQASNGWTAGVDASVALATMGADGSIDTNTARSPVIAFVLTNGGLMANLSIEGTKINRLAL